MTTRKKEACTNCGEQREIAARGLCFRCYRRDERADDKKFTAVDRHSPAIRREHKKLFRGFTAVMTGLSDLGVQRREVLAIREMLQPYIMPIAEFLNSAPTPEETPETVNSEHDGKTAFAVHTETKPGRSSDRDGGSKYILVTTGAAALRTKP